jgi:hypothetical protein
MLLVWFGLVIALRPQTPKRIRDGWSHYSDTSELLDGTRNGAQNMVTVQSGFEPATFRSLAHELNNCSNQAHMLLGEGRARLEFGKTQSLLDFDDV